MKWLIWREYRLNRLVLMAGLVVSLLPYAMGLVDMCWWMPWDLRGPEVVVEVVGVFGMAAFYSVVLGQLTMALLGGNAIAGERADRSAEFIAYLPLSRPRRLASKLILTVAAMVLLWAVNLVFMLIPATIFPEAGHLFPGPACIFLVYLAITGLTFFGVGWLVSSLQSSPTFAVCGGLISPLVIFMCLFGAAWARGTLAGPFYDRWMGIGYAITCSVVAVVCFSVGTWYYLRRVEP